MNLYVFLFGLYRFFHYLCSVIKEQKSLNNKIKTDIWL